MSLLYGDWSFRVAFVGYLTVVIAVGIFACWLTRNLSDYVLGGRRLGGAVAALSAGASDMSSWLLMGLPGAIYLNGLNNIWVSLGLVIGAYFCWRLVAKPLRIYSEVANDSVTIPAYLDNRFQDSGKHIRVISAFAVLVFFIFYIAAGLYAGGILMQKTFDLTYLQGLAASTVIIMLYTSVGGFLAVSWTDFFQGTLMLICLLIVPYFAAQGLGGTEQVIHIVSDRHPNYFSWTHGLSVMKLISLLAWGLGYFGMPHILVRFMSVKTVKEIPLARRVCMNWMTLSLIAAMAVGVVGAAKFCDCPLDNHETVFIVLSEQIFSPWMMGIILAAILSSSMCAIDSQMLAASSALTEDLYRAILNPKASQKQLVWIGRLTVGFIAAVSIYIAQAGQESIMDLVSFAWAGLSSTFGPAIVLSLFWERTTKKGVVWGMCLGMFTVLSWRFFDLKNLFPILKDVYEILPGNLLGLLGVFLGSVLDQKPDPKIIEQFRTVKSICDQDNQKKQGEKTDDQAKSSIILPA
ncbi:MAG: sodium/proline symporter PutP [Gammaproteobacteria bacterium]